MALLEVKNLSKHFVVERSFWGRPTKILKAVNGVSLKIQYKETLGLVGESGCGKSTTGRTIMGLYRPTSGEVVFNGEKISGYGKMHKDIQMIFQDPYASLNPRMTVADIIGEPLDIHRLYSVEAEKRQRIYELLELVGLSREQANRFPHEFSGGQRQRIGIARALACEPKLIICDEPISALDVSIQAQVINLLERLQKELGLTYLFIAHDLAMVRYISQKVAVMYLGRIVEMAQTEELYENPLHPYTKALLSSIPVPDPKVEKMKRRILLKGELPNPLNPPHGCPFNTRCPYAEDICKKEVPELKNIDGRKIACHLV
ncbi:MAG TPA: ATP-binding cassette domain-containing protein [Candidatus Megamonas gallistercoris]|nr:ATP-binding cassette domain-containing protein [Candidatus Megamonas gallistercoris]